MRKTRWSWYFLMSGIGVVCAEGLSGSTPIIYPTGIFTLLIYALHYILIIDFLAQRQAITLRSLAIGGLVLGFTTESLLTKVIWNPPWDAGDTTRLLGLGVYEVGFIVMVWHVWMSMAIPFALGLTYFGYAGLLDAQQARRILRYLPLTLVFTATISGVDPALMVGATVLNATGIWLSAWWYRRQAPLTDNRQIILTRGERRLVWVLTILFYILVTPTRPEAFPAGGPFLLGMALVIGSVILLVAVRRADAGKMPAANSLRFQAGAYRRYMFYFVALSAVGMIIGVITMPVSTGVAVVGALLLLLVGDFYVVRLAWRLLPLLWRRERVQIPVLIESAT